MDRQDENTNTPCQQERSRDPQGLALLEGVHMRLRGLIGRPNRLEMLKETTSLCLIESQAIRLMTMEKRER
jgi:hypothetical protein